MKNNTYNLVLSAVFTALVCVITLYIQIPIPLGYFNIGNSVILVACMLLGRPYGIFAGSVGSGLADLLSYPVYTIPTLFIKALMPIIFYSISGNAKIKNSNIRLIVAAAVSTLIPLFGYTAVGCVLYGGFAAGMAQFPGLLLEYAANLIIYSVAGISIANSPALKRRAAAEK